MEPSVLVSAVVSLAAIVIVALLRSQFGETQAKKMVAYGQLAAHTAYVYMEAAKIAVVEIENGLKKAGESTDAELKAAAAELAGKILSSWGIYVDQSLIATLIATVEAAYQKMKAEKQYTTQPVLE